MQGEREADWHLALGEPLDPRTQPTVEIAVRRWVIPMSGSRRHASSTASRFIGSPIPMNAVVDGIEPPEVERLVDDLSRGQVAPELHLPVAQNVQVRGQPDCDETQIDRRPSR